MITEAIARKPARKKAPAIPQHLVRDEIEGKLYPYRGWQDVVNGTKTLDEIMACSTLQAETLAYLTEFFHTKIGTKKHRFYTGESGLHLRKRVNMGLDVAIYDKQVLTGDKINPHYADVPPKIVMEIDIKVDVGKQTELEYIREKSQELLDFGTEKVFWILSSSRQVIVAASSSTEWVLLDWNRDVELMDGHFFNIGKRLAGKKESSLFEVD